MIHRRSFLTGLAALIAAPAIVRASSIMPVRALPPAWLGPDGGYLVPEEFRCSLTMVLHPSQMEAMQYLVRATFPDVRLCTSEILLQWHGEPVPPQSHFSHESHGTETHVLGRSGTCE